MLLTACSSDPVTTNSTTVPATTAVIPTTSPSTAPTEDTTIPATLPTEPAHSALYIPGIDAEDVITWFSEVCLAAEFVNSGNPNFLQKWDCTIFYMIHGNPTKDDRAILESFAQWLNAMDGFPGIYETVNPLEANLDIYFCTYPEMISLMGDWTYGLDGCVTFWYDGADRIYDATICVRTDLSQHLRNSVILEELYNGLGPIQDTSLRSDSLIYADYSTPQELTNIDKLILQLLYHPDMKCNMNFSQCENVIRELYY